MERETRSSSEHIWSTIKFALWKRFFIEKAYKRCLQDTRLFANELEANGKSPSEVSIEVQNRLKKSCPDLEIIVDGNDIYIEVVSVETRIYFDWRARIRSK